MAAYLAVAKYRKPHGLKGEAVVVPLTGDPDAVLALGRRLTPVSEDGEPQGEGWVISRSRPFHRKWLLQFEGVTDRGVLETWPQMYLGVPAGELEAPRNDEMYLHEIPGATVLVDGDAIGEAAGLIESPGGDLLQVVIDGREVLVPFRAPILKVVNRADRTIEIDPPAGLLEI